MAMILNYKEHIQKTLEEVERNYSKGMEFQLGDLYTVKAAQNTSNFNMFLSMCNSKLLTSGLVISLGGNGLNHKFRKK